MILNFTKGFIPLIDSCCFFLRWFDFHTDTLFVIRKYDRAREDDREFIHTDFDNSFLPTQQGGVQEEAFLDHF